MKSIIQIAAPESVPFNSSFFASPAKSPQLMTESDLCAYLRVSRRNLYNWRMSGLIPYVKIGKAVRFRPSDVENALQLMTTQRERKP